MKHVEQNPHGASIHVPGHSVPSRLVCVYVCACARATMSSYGPDSKPPKATFELLPPNPTSRRPPTTSETSSGLQHGQNMLLLDNRSWSLWIEACIPSLPPRMPPEGGPFPNPSHPQGIMVLGDGPTCQEVTLVMSDSHKEKVKHSQVSFFYVYMYLCIRSPHDTSSQQQKVSLRKRYSPSDGPIVTTVSNQSP